MSEIRAQRLRLLGVAGVAAPAAMILVGLLLSWLATGDLPDLAAPTVIDLLWGVGTAGLSMGLVTLLYRSSESFERALRESGTRVGQDALKLAGYPVMLAVVVAAAVGEEVLFRGGLQPLVGLVPAALVFGFSHGGWRREMWAYAVAASVSGLLFGLAYHLTGHLWVTILAHALHNVASTFLLGKRVDVSWEGFWPVVRLVPDEEDEEEDDDPIDEVSPAPVLMETADEEEVPNEPVGEPVPIEADRPDDGDDDRPAADRPPE